MHIDLKSLEDRVTKLIGVCTSLRDENQQLRFELDKARQDTAKLKGNMQKASSQLEMLLETLPNEEVAK
jgi:cell division protein ZapB